MSLKTCSSVLGDNNDKMVFSVSADESSSPQSGQSGCSENSRGNDHITSSFSGDCHINNLPRELLIYIFSFLSVPELCISVAPVCTAWRQFSQDPILWTCLVFKGRVEGEKVQRILERSPLLLSLELRHRQDGGDLLLQVATHCTRLRKLVLFCTSMTESAMKSLTENCPDISSLDFDFFLKFPRNFYEILTGFKQLRYLNLRHCDMDSSELETIAKQCKLLEYLDIDGNPDICDDAVVCLTKELRHCLKNLFFDGSNLSDTAYQSLQACQELQQLGVTNCGCMTDVGLTGISGLKDLTLLKLRIGIQLTSKGLMSLFRSGGLPLLTYVDLTYCYLLDDTVLKTLSHSCPKLVHLVLQRCNKVTNTGISAVVVGCPRLRVLDLAGVVELTGTPFIDLPSALPDLLILFLEDCCKVDDTILRHIVAQKPSLKVFNFRGDQMKPPGWDGCENEGSRNRRIASRISVPFTDFFMRDYKI